MYLSKQTYNLVRLLHYMIRMLVNLVIISIPMRFKYPFLYLEIYSEGRLRPKHGYYVLFRLDDMFFLYGIPIDSEFLNAVFQNISTHLTQKMVIRIMSLCFKEPYSVYNFSREKKSR